MLFGKNKDGSERVEYIDDPKWVDPPRSRSNSSSDSLKLSEERKNSLNNSSSLFKLDWCVIMDADEECERKEIAIKNKHVCPKIKVLLDPLMIPMIKGSNKYSERLYMEQALPSDVENICHNNIIKSTNIPEDITIADLNDKFYPFVSNHDAIYKRKLNGKMIEHRYPYIVINNDRTAFIIFEENTDDAKFAIHMSKKTYIKEEKLWFVFSNKKDIIDDSNKNSNNRTHNSPNNHNNSPKIHNNNSPKNHSPKNHNNNSPKNHNRSPHGFNNRNQSNNSSSPNSLNDEDVVDTDGFRYVKYNRK